MLMVLLYMCKRTYYKDKQKSFVIRYKQIGIDVNADGSKHMVISRDQNAGLIHNIKIHTSHLKGWKISNSLEQPK